jgi:CMP-N-acetylneuraminic acid synthetase
MQNQVFIMSNIKFVAEIPARLGSKRVKQKNLRLIDGKPMIAYAIEACKCSDKISEIYINTESELIGSLADEFGVNFYKRKPELATDKVVSDQFNYDFLQNIDCDALVMVNPVSPLVEAEDINSAIEYYLEHDLDTLVTVRNEQLQAFFEGEALNFSTNGLLPMTQNISPIQLCVWTVCIWNKRKFMESYEKNGYAVFCGKVGLWPISPIKSIKVSYEDDFRMAEQILKARNLSSEDYKAEYYRDDI